MPMIAFPCPKCGATLKAPVEKVGARSKCRQCGCPVQVPGPALAGVAPPPTPYIPEQRPGGGYESPDAGTALMPAGQVRFGCPSCRTVMTAPARQVGSKVNCPSCGQRVQVPPPPRPKTLLGEALPNDTLAPAPAPVGGRGEIVVPSEAAPARVNYRARSSQINVTQQVIVPTGGLGLAGGLGVSSLIVSVLGFLFCWMPLIGIIIALLGLALGVAGLIVSVLRHRAALGFAIAGTALGFLALVLSLYFTVAMAQAIDKMDQERQRQNQRGF